MPSIDRPKIYFQAGGHCYSYKDDGGSDCSCSGCSDSDDEEVIPSEYPTPVPGSWLTCPVCRHRMIYYNAHWLCAVCPPTTGHMVYADCYELAEYHNSGR
jgi:hypothetical protein